MSRSRAGLYEVVDVVPKSHMVLREASGGSDPIVVREVLGSQQIIRWMWVVARVIELEGELCFSGTTLPLDTEGRKHLEQAIEVGVKESLKSVPKYMRKLPGQRARALEQVSAAIPALATSLWLAGLMDRMDANPMLAVTEGVILDVTNG